MFTSLFKFGRNALIIISYGFGKSREMFWGIIIYSAHRTPNEKNTGRIFFQLCGERAGNGEWAESVGVVRSCALRKQQKLFTLDRFTAFDVKTRLLKSYRRLRTKLG